MELSRLDGYKVDHRVKIMPCRKPKLSELHFPQDRLLAEMLSDKKIWIVRYHEHDSLLENKIGEDLSEEDRKKAWEEYEAEKKGIYTAARASEC